MKRLFLSSYIKHPETIQTLKEYLGGFNGKSIAYIPTASNGEEGWENWKHKKGGSWEFVQKLGAEVQLVVLEEYRNDSVLRQLVGKDVIWFAGGMAGYLMYWVRRCSIDTNIDKLLEKGSLFVGSSAGAMIAGKTLQISGFSIGDRELGAENIKPLGLVDFDIFPHYDESFLPEIKKFYKGKKLYLLKDGEVIIVEDGNIKLVGEERIITNEK